MFFVQLLSFVTCAQLGGACLLLVLVTFYFAVLLCFLAYPWVTDDCDTGGDFVQYLSLLFAFSVRLIYKCIYPSWERSIEGGKKGASKGGECISCFVDLKGEKEEVCFFFGFLFFFRNTRR